LTVNQFVSLLNGVPSKEEIQEFEGWETCSPEKVKEAYDRILSQKKAE